MRTVGFRHSTGEGTPRLELEFDRPFHVRVEVGGEKEANAEVIAML